MISCTTKHGEWRAIDFGRAIRIMDINSYIVVTLTGTKGVKHFREIDLRFYDSEGKNTGFRLTGLKLDYFRK
jgi:hypothetical protein